MKLYILLLIAVLYIYNSSVSAQQIMIDVHVGSTYSYTQNTIYHSYIPPAVELLRPFSKSFYASIGYQSRQKIEIGCSILYTDIENGVRIGKLIHQVDTTLKKPILTGSYTSIDGIQPLYINLYGGKSWGINDNSWVWGLKGGFTLIKMSNYTRTPTYYMENMYETLYYERANDVYHKGWYPAFNTSVFVGKTIGEKHQIRMSALTNIGFKTIWEAPIFVELNGLNYNFHFINRGAIVGLYLGYVYSIRLKQ